MVFLEGGEIEINDVDRQVKAGSIGLDYRGDRFRTSLDVLYHNYTITGNTAVPVLGAGTAVPRPIRAGHNWIPHNGKTHIEDYSIVSQSEYDLTPDWTLFSKFGYHYWDWHLRGIGTGLVQSNGDYTPFISDTGRYQKDSVAEIGIRGKFSTWDIDHSVAVSGSYNHREVGIGNYGSVFTGIRSNLYNPIFINYPKFERTKDPLTDKYNFSSFAITDTMSLFDERLLITAGLRYQNIAHRKFAVDGSVTSRSDVGALTPSLGVVVKPIENVSIYASYIEGLTPGFEVTDSLAPNFGAVFDPVRTKSYEAGVKWDLGRFSTTVALFQISEPSISADSSQVYSQNGMKRVRGVEWNVFGEVTPELRVLGGLAFMDGRVVETADGLNDGNKASGVPNVQANLGIEWDTPWVRGLTLTGRFTHTGSQYVRSDNTQKIPSWNRVDLGARYETTVNGSPLTIRASVDNVFNKSYWESTYYDLFLIPNSPRTYRLSATVKF